MRLFGLLIILAATAISCQTTKNEETVATMDSLTEKDVKTLDNSSVGGANDNPIVKEFDKFEITFQHEDIEQKLKQRLGVSWLTNDSIEFRLENEYGICYTHFRGTAKNRFANSDPESDEDETGESYLASEFVTEEDGYLLKLRISLDKDRARVNFVDKFKKESDCKSIPNVVMIKKNTH